ncbi:DUF262 domain-containing protein [Aminobacter anthyllidis]|uniref:DUF262 domain-containing protein n=1 Tax=Aminobacter anthyllidis TaxID=1035067 RepID=A0A9X1AHZ3_9HYPH|nr:DUF262 domain-containing protein [Aminobacter anthyllidis]MBT1159997.1 DUF262 domain-containing protein [Aminobacter anthyllidis]
MAQLQVTDINVPNLLKKLKTNEWLVPQFQREFVWSNAAVISLVNSIIDARPIGMITLWEQQDQSALVLEPISIPDWDPEVGRTGQRQYTSESSRPGRYYAVLDGRQRSTALAMAFGGLRAQSGLYRHSGNFYLDVAATDENERVKFVSLKEVERRKIVTLAGAISQGLFPLASEDPDSLMGQWMSYLQHIRNPDYYTGGKLPDVDELERRNQVLSRAFAGILNTKLAVYIVPNEYNLADICDIFETLNTTGTKVSPVDLIHSGLFNDTATDVGGPVLLREEIDSLGELDGAVGWSSSKDRPELIAQFVAAAHVALDTKPTPRKTAGQKEVRITSVKSGDLLAIPSGFWRKVFENNSIFAGFIGGFQNAVAGGHFGMSECPYPASAAVYVALRWFLEFDSTPAVHWNIDKLDRLFRAFFWRNVLHTRYDQGFLTQIGTDIRQMKEFLQSTRSDTADDFWRTQANLWLDNAVGPRPSIEDIGQVVTDGDEKGALRRGALLLLHARAGVDPINPDLSINLESGTMDLHHIYPKDWCKNNAGGPLQEILDHTVAERDWVNSAANLIPMHRRTNNEWRKLSPATFLAQTGASYDNNQDVWARYFVSRDSFDELLLGEGGVTAFWKMRADAISQEIFGRTIV